jgi:hypothetical protein
MKKYLIVDTETSSLPFRYDVPFTDLSNWPRIIQLSWELCWENGETIKKICELVQPDGWTFPTGQFWKDNGFNEADNCMLGLPMKDLLIDLAIAMNQADVLIAHNIDFDKPIIEAEMLRYRVFPKEIRRTETREEVKKLFRPEGVKLKKDCTKFLSTPIVKLHGFRGNYAWPKLEVAYEFMFGKPFIDGHDAGQDVQACKEIYLWIQSMNEII